MTSCSEKCPELRRCRPLLGTFVEITARGGAAVVSGVEAAFAAIARAQSLLSYHDPSSELSLLNTNASSEPVQVDDWTFEVLALAQRVYLASGGCFDPVVIPKPEQTGNQRRPDKLPHGLARASFSDVALLPDNHVRFLRSLRLDLGGIAKGFAIDRAIEALRVTGVSDALVNAGGDMRAFGKHRWPVVVRDPTSPGQLRSMWTLRDSALATSAVYFSRRRTSAGRWISAIVLPHSQQVWLARASVTVQAPDAATADALTKVLALRGPLRARAILVGFKADGWWLANDGRLQSTQTAPCAAA